jgi:RHS repeat-associated protein
MTTHPTIAAGRFLFGLAMALLMICSGADAALPDAAFASTTPADAPTTTAPEVRQALENTLTDKKPAGYSYDDGLLLAELEKSVPIADLASLTQPRVSFQGLWHDPTTGLAYARNRWYDARTASWLSEDPLGPVDSPNLYAFVAWGPHLYRDPFGLETAAKALGVRGEWFLAQKLRKLGWTVLLGPDVHLWNQPGADIFAVNLKTGEVAFFDDKNWIRKSVSKSGVKALWKNFDISRNIEQALKAIEESDLDEDSKRRFRRKLRFGQFDKVVTAAAPEAQTVGISKSAEKEMIKFMDVSKVEVPDPGPNSGIPDVPKSRTRAIRMRSGGKAPFLIAVVGICFAEDPAYAFGEAIDPVSMVTGGCSEFITDEEAEQIMIENAFLAALYERLECESTSGCSDADEVPLIPAHEVSNTYLESLRSEGWIEVGSSVGAGTQ